MNNLHSVLIVAVASFATMATRFLPFLLFRNKEKTPSWITYLGSVLPYAIMGMLVVYCFKDTAFLQYPYGIPELLGCAAVIGLHIWKRNTLLSIGGGTLFYMILLQFVF